jgi:hypothetical protein
MSIKAIGDCHCGNPRISDSWCIPADDERILNLNVQGQGKIGKIVKIDKLGSFGQ